MPNPNENPMPAEQGLVRPVITRNTPRLGNAAVMVAPKGDFDLLKGRWNRAENDIDRGLYLGNVTGKQGAFCAFGPLLGAPFAAMVLETLTAWGARRFLFYGWCGSIDEAILPGEMILPTAAFIDEGTSTHYGYALGDCVPAASNHERIQSLLTAANLPYRKGPIWTTDAVYRETPSRIRRFQQLGALGVEMEISALFSVAQHLRVEVEAILLVSDRVSPERWHPGFRDPAFRERRNQIVDLLTAWCQQP